MSGQGGDPAAAVAATAAAATAAATAAAATAALQAQAQVQNQGQGAGGQGAGAQPPVVPFILTPSAGTPNVYIDFSLPKNQKIYYKGIEKLDSALFDGTAEELILLKQLLTDRAREMDWNNSIIDIPVDPANPAVTKDIITEHSQITTSQITSWATTKFVNIHNRAAQDNMMMFNCLTRSVDRNCRKKMIPEINSYTVSKVPIAALYYKLLVNKCQIQSRATTLNIRTQISDLTNKIITLKYDIDDLHAYVNQLIVSINGYGESISDEELVLHLFAAYVQVPDEDFKTLIKAERSKYSLGNAQLKHQDLMHTAKDIYDMRLSNLVEPYMAKSTEQIQIEALTAQLELAKTTRNHNKTNLSSKKQRSAKKKKAAAAAAAVAKKDSKKNDGEKKADAWAWKKDPPKEGEPKTKQVKGKTYNWCIHHKKWCLHTEAECQIGQKIKQQEQKEAMDAEVDEGEMSDSENSNTSEVLAAFCEHSASE